MLKSLVWLRIRYEKKVTRSNSELHVFGLTDALNIRQIYKNCDMGTHEYGKRTPV